MREDKSHLKYALESNFQREYILLLILLPPHLNRNPQCIPSLHIFDTTDGSDGSAEFGRDHMIQCIYTKVGTVPFFPPPATLCDLRRLL